MYPVRFLMKERPNGGNMTIRGGGGGGGSVVGPVCEESTRLIGYSI